MPSARFEYDSAKIKIVRIKATDVRGMIDAGRWVSSAACEIDSSPTKETIASDVPFMRSNGEGQLCAIVCTRSCGLNAKRKPRVRIAVSLTTSSALTNPLKAVDSRTPTTLSAHSPPINAVVSKKCTHGKAVDERTGKSAPI